MKHQIKSIHPMGERKKSEEITEKPLCPVDTYAGRLHVEWDPQAAVTPLGQLPFFIEFLKTTKLFDELVEECPLKFTSNSASNVRDILGSMMLSVLSGHTRYSHLNALRGEKINAELLGMEKIVSEDVVRRSLLAIDENEGVLWLEKNLKKCYESLLTIPWILDLDATVKPLYGNQEGADIGYNPTKPGRPAHIYHSYFIANIRIALNVDVQSGKKISGCYSMPGLWKLLESIPQDQWPQFIRGDVSYGTEKIMTEAESRDVKYLFKLKSTSKIKALIKDNMEKNADWEKAGHGYEGVEDTIQLHGWSRARRVIILRRRIANRDVGILKKEGSANQHKQLTFDFAQIDNKTIAYEYAILVTNLDNEIMTLAQHYRDRGDSENNFDELKNQWGWCGFTTHDLKRCNIIGKFIALIYDWWNIFVRLVDPHSHREATTSRPLLLNSVGKLTEHGRQKILTITSTHAKIEKVTKILTTISSFFKSFQRTAEQLTSVVILKQIIEVAFRKFFKTGNKSPPKALPAPA
jgi:Transposase DDE domain group 1